jgi:hypothetical protein
MQCELRSEVELLGPVRDRKAAAQAGPGVFDPDEGPEEGEVQPTGLTCRQEDRDREGPADDAKDAAARQRVHGERREEPLEPGDTADGLPIENWILLNMGFWALISEGVDTEVTRCRPFWIHSSLS